MTPEQIEPDLVLEIRGVRVASTPPPIPSAWQRAARALFWSSLLATGGLSLADGRYLLGVSWLAVVLWGLASEAASARALAALSRRCDARVAFAEAERDDAKEQLSHYGRMFGFTRLRAGSKDDVQ